MKVLASGPSGVSGAAVQPLINAGKVLEFAIEIVTGLSACHHYPHAVKIHLVPPSMKNAKAAWAIVHPKLMYLTTLPG